MTKCFTKGATIDSLFLAIVNVVTTVTALIQTKILSVGLSLSDYGTYSQVNLVATIATSLTMMGFNEGLSYFFNSRQKHIEKKREQYVNTIFALQFTSGILIAFFIVLFRKGIANYFGNELLSSLVIIFSIKPLFTNVLYLYQILFVSISKSKLIAVRNLLISITKLVVVFVSVNLMDNVSILLVLLIVIDIVQYYVLKRMFICSGYSINCFGASIQCVKPVIKYCAPMGIVAVTNILSREIDKLVVGKMAGTETLAIYANCSKLLPFDVIVMAFATVLIPFIMQYVSSGRYAESVRLFRNYLRIGYYTVWTMAVSVLLVSEQAIRFLYSPEYIAGKGVFTLYLFDSMVKFASLHLVLNASGHTKTVMCYSIISLLLNSLLNIVFFSLFGIIGPAFATLFVSIIYLALIIRKTCVVLRTKVDTIVELPRLLMFILTLLISGCLFYQINQLLLNIDVNWFIAMIISMGGFIVINVLINLRQILTAMKEINSCRLDG